MRMYRPIIIMLIFVLFVMLFGMACDGTDGNTDASGTDIVQYTDCRYTSRNTMVCTQIIDVQDTDKLHVIPSIGDGLGIGDAITDLLP